VQNEDSPQAGHPSPQASHAPYDRVLRSLSNKSTSSIEDELFGCPQTTTADRGQTADAKRCSTRVKACRSWYELRTELAAVERAGVMNPKLLAIIFSCMPKILQGRSSEQERAEVAAAAAALAETHLDQLMDCMDGQGLVNVAVGLAKLGHTQPQVFHKLASSSVQHIRAGHMSAQGLSNLLWALATAGVRPAGSWLSELWVQLEEHMQEEQLGSLQPGELSLQDLANVSWACCRLEVLPPWVSGSMPGFLPTLLRGVERAGSNLSGGDVATILTTMAIWSRTFSYKPSETMLAKLLALCQPHLAQFLPQDLVSIVHSLVVMNAPPSRPWMSSYYLVLRDRLIFDPTLSYSDFQRLLWALSRIDHVPSQAWLKQFVEVSRVKLRHLRFRALSELIWALSCWGYTPSSEWLHEYYRVTLPKLKDDYKCHHLANSVLALKKLGAQVPTEWLDAALSSFCDQLNEAKAHDLVVFIDGMVDCDNAEWMARGSTGKRLLMLANHGASKFDLCVPVQFAKLLVALATASVLSKSSPVRPKQERHTRGSESLN